MCIIDIALTQQVSDQSQEEDTNAEQGDQLAAKASSSVTPRDQMDLKVSRKNLDEIIHKYTSYVDCLRTCIEVKGITPEALQTYLLSLPASTNTYKGQKLTLLSNKKIELLSTKTIVEIFSFLTTECASFLNCDIFETILENYKISVDQEELKYCDHLKAYVEKCTITEFVKVTPPLKLKSGYKELTLKYEIANVSNIGKVDELKKLVAKLLDLSPLVLHIVHIIDGCVVVTFFLAASVAEVIFTPDRVFTPQQEGEFRAASVLWLKCNGYIFNFVKRKDEEATHPGTKPVNE